MVIKNIKIKNFQSYLDPPTIEFSEGLNLIIGKGGKGKSKLFNAFYWVLFGDIYITDVGWKATDGFPYNTGFKMKRHEFINHKALSETLIGEAVRAGVYLEIEDDRGVLYEIERSVIATRLDNESWLPQDAWEVSNNTLKVTYESNTGSKLKIDTLAEDVIKENLFPEGIRNYIWFQGESLDSLINFRDSDTLKKAVKHISYFPSYEKANDIITKAKIQIGRLETKKLNEKNKSNSAIKNLLSKREALQNAIISEERTKSTIETRVTMIEMALVEDEGKVSGLANFSKLVSEYEKCEADRKLVMEKLTNLDDYQRKQVPELWILRGISPMINDCARIIRKHTEIQDTVPEKKYLDNPGRNKLEEILKDEKCFVCGSEVKQDSDAYNWITQRLLEQQLYLQEMEEYTSNLEFSKQFERFVGSIQEYPNILNVSLNAIDKQYQDSEDEMEKLLAQRRVITEKKKKLDDEIDEVKKKHGVDPVKQINEGEKFTNSIRASRSNLDKEKRRLAASIATIKSKKSELKEIEKELERTGGKSGSTVVDETEWKNISIFLEDICKRVKENARKDLLRKIEDRANFFYQKFTEHDNGYKGEVVINDDYSIDFDPNLNTSHDDRKKMSIINAMLSLNQEALNTYYPFITDAPTSSFDLVTTHNYLLGLKDIFGQSIIMTKDIDIESDIFTDLMIQPKVSKIYHLESKLYRDDDKAPDLHEVSTTISRLK
ncbi:MULTISPECIES: AAA family ATPase [Sphingobacterium]|uniref:AAA family ATPase n=1 Tax=Sphingobacterium populi TaxID=1812824 RepID=A0ABW5UHI4_9SPHI|nr:AAA family ATPase [Sphingobacterium sp. CFCC 11742]